MPSSDEIASRGISAENNGLGAQYLKTGAGNQNAATGHATLFQIDNFSKPKN